MVIITLELFFIDLVVFVYGLGEYLWFIKHYGRRFISLCIYVRLLATSRRINQTNIILYPLLSLIFHVGNQSESKTELLMLLHTKTLAGSDKQADVLLIGVFGAEVGSKLDKEKKEVKTLMDLEGLRLKNEDRDICRVFFSHLAYALYIDVVDAMSLGRSP